MSFVWIMVMEEQDRMLEICLKQHNCKHLLLSVTHLKGYNKTVLELN